MEEKLNIEKGCLRFGIFDEYMNMMNVDGITDLRVWSPRPTYYWTRESVLGRSKKNVYDI